VVRCWSVIASGPLSVVRCLLQVAGRLLIVARGRLLVVLLLSSVFFLFPVLPITDHC